MENPSYAYIECTIRRSPNTFTEEGKIINCIFDVVKFPTYIGTIDLPSDISIIDCEVSNSHKIVKKLEAWTCKPKFNGNIFLKIIHEPRCVKEDYNMILFSSEIKINKSYYNLLLHILVHVLF